jgi:hypothetical protein
VAQLFSLGCFPHPLFTVTVIEVIDDMLLFEFSEQAASGTRIPRRRQVALLWSRPESVSDFRARHWLVTQQPNKALERNARWRWLVVRKDRWLFHIVGRAWLSFFR